MNLRKTEIIEVEEGLVLEMQFTAFNVDDCVSCSCDHVDHVTIKNGDGVTLMENTCGSSLPAAVISNSNNVEIYFHTDDIIIQTSGAGWSLTWRAVTPGT